MAEEIRFNELANVGELSPSAIVAIVQEQQGELVSLQCSAAQIADLIVNGIQFQALTSEDKKIVGAINEILAKVDDLELFKFPNATIIGTPTINNGQISGFSQTSYLQFPFLMDFQGRHFAINMEFTTAADVTNQQNIFDSDFGLAFAIRSGKFVIAVSSNGTSWNIGEGVGTHTVLSNTTYRVQLAWDGTAYKLAYSVNGGESYTEDISLASTASPFPKQVYIGVGENYASVLNFFKGIINLNYASLYVADSLVWQGMDDVGLASRLATDLSNIDAAGEQRIKDIAGGGGGGSNVTMVENPAGGVVLTVENQKQTLAKQEDLAAELAEIRKLNDKLFDTTESINILNSELLTDEYLKTDGSTGASTSQKTTPFMVIPNGKKIVITRGDSRQASTYRTTQNGARMFLYNLNESVILESAVTSVNEISNNTGSDKLVRFSFGGSALPYIINMMVELMDISTPSSSAIGYTIFVPYSQGGTSDTLKPEVIASPLKGKKIMFFGDSFTYDSNGSAFRYHTAIKNRTDCSTIIHGLTGSNIIYKGDSSVASMSSETRLNELTEDNDMIVIFGGINDSRNTVTSPSYYVIGNMSDTWDSSANTNTLYASLKHIIETLVNRFPTKTIVALLPPCLNPNADRFTNYDAVCEAEIEVYKSYGIPYLDLRSASTISTLSEHIAIYNMGFDNVHWNNDGHERASFSIQKFLELNIR